MQSPIFTQLIYLVTYTIVDWMSVTIKNYYKNNFKLIFTLVKLFFLDDFTCLWYPHKKYPNK